ncbi:MAG: type II secretion system F family protein [Desulfobulbaceae bacterium]|nr:type II secretion system F family protein [Desulfobulbaceae bacterium]
MENYAIFIAGGIFLLIVFILLLMGRYGSKVLKERDIVSRALRYGRQRSVIYDDNDDYKEDGLVSDLKSLFTVVGNKNGDNQTEVFTEVPRDFQCAGIYSLLSIRIYHFIQYSILLLVPGLGFLYILLTRRNLSLNFVLFVVMLTIICYLLPVFWLKLRSYFRKKKIERFFPDSIDLLVVCVESGMGLDSAIHRVSMEMAVTSPELALEFKILSLELKTGKARSECLNNLGKRVDLSDVTNLINLLVQAEKFGTGVAKALRVHSDEMRQKRFQRFEEKAAKLPVKLSVPLIFFIFPALFFVIMGPAVIQIYRAFIQ